MAENVSIGKYEILGTIGRGGFATVYKARDPSQDRLVALKVLHPHLAGEQVAVARFYQEAQLATQLQHDNIVSVYEIGEDNGQLYIAMACLAGQTLAQILDAEGTLSPERTVAILEQAAQALDYAHGHNAVHRDVKPSNVMIEESEQGELHVTLMDFGLVKALESSAELTATGTILGSPEYMAPEQADPKKWGEATPLTDVYALGVMAYRMLTAREPFQGKVPAVLHAHAYDPPPSPLEFAPHLGEDVAAVLMCALSKSPRERYPGAYPLVAALRQAIRVQSLLEQAQAARGAGDWLTVQSCCVQVMQIDRRHPRALRMMVEATNELQQESSGVSRLGCLPGQFLVQGYGGDVVLLVGAGVSNYLGLSTLDDLLQQAILGSDDVANRIQRVRNAIEAAPRLFRAVFEEMISRLRYYLDVAEVLRQDFTFNGELGAVPTEVNNGALRRKWWDALTRCYRILLNEFGPGKIDKESIEFRTVLKLVDELAKINSGQLHIYTTNYDCSFQMLASHCKSLAFLTHIDNQNGHFMKGWYKANPKLPEQGQPPVFVHRFHGCVAWFTGERWPFGVIEEAYGAGGNLVIENDSYLHSMGIKLTSAQSIGTNPAFALAFEEF